jgi:glycosyltransferase involved in cell wall biosynthesis
MRERTICHVFDLGATTGGSFIPLIASLARAVTARGGRFVAFATDVPGATWPDELRASGADLHLVREDREVVAGLRALQPAIVHTHFTRYDLPVLRGAPRARIFWHVHSHREILSPLARIKAFVKYQLLSRRVEAVVTVSGAMRDECIAWYTPPERIRVVYNAVDPERFRLAQPEERAAARSDFGISPSDRVILFFERRPYKGGAALRRALALLPDHRLLVLGGAKADRDLFGDAPRVIAIERVADSRRAYWAVDALAFPSENEAFGAVVIEALACGVPVATSDIPVVHEICDGVESAFIVPQSDARALAEALRRASSCTSVASGRERVKERFSLDRWTQDILALYM